MKNQNNKLSFPIYVKYKDEIALIRKLLDLYSVIWKDMTPRTKDLLTICIFYDVNADSFIKNVINSGIGFTSVSQVKTAISRAINDYNFIRVDEITKKKSLCKELTQLQNFVKANKEKKNIVLNYVKES